MATTTQTHTGAEGGESKFPPLDTSSFPSQLLWLVIFFGALYLLMSRLVLPKLGAIITTRKAQIDGDMARAQVEGNVVLAAKITAAPGDRVIDLLTMDRRHLLSMMSDGLEIRGAEIPRSRVACAVRSVAA